MHRIKPFACLLLAAAMAAAPLAAESAGAFAGYREYGDEPVQSGVALDKGLLGWMLGAKAALPASGSTFLIRKDEGHWMGIGVEAGSLVLRIHDETARFNFRAMVGQRTGALTVLAGVDRYGTSREADAAWAARMAVTYLERLRSGEAVFARAAAKEAAPKDATVPKDAAAAAKSGASAAHPAPAAASPAAADAHGAKPAPADAKPAAPAVAAVLPAKEAWALLEAGNARFVAGKPTRPNQDGARRAEVAKGQKPFAVVVTCSDSRLPPEILFDRGLGDLFVVRTAGEVVGDLELGSIEYAVEHLGANFILVLGHERCGAVDATVKGGELPPDIAAIARLIEPAVRMAQEKGGDVLDAAIRQNAVDVMAEIARADIVKEAAHGRGLSLAAAYYDLDTGAVTKIK